MTRRATFTKAKLVTALNAAKEAGFEIGSCTITPDNAIIITSKGEDQESPLDAWRRQKNAGGNERGA